RTSVSGSAGNSSIARGRFDSSSFMKPCLAAAAQFQRFRFLHSVAPDGGLVALPIERTMAKSHRPFNKVEADAEVGAHEAFAVHAAVMNVVESSGSEGR